MTSDEETTNMEVVDLEKLCNFVVDNFFIWIHLVPQTINLHSVCYNMWGRKTQYRHKWERGGVVEEVMREREVTSLNPTGREAREFYANPTGREAREFYAKNTARVGIGWWVPHLVQ